MTGKVAGRSFIGDHSTTTPVPLSKKQGYELRPPPLALQRRLHHDHRDGCFEGSADPLHGVDFRAAPIRLDEVDAHGGKACRLGCGLLAEVLLLPMATQDRPDTTGNRTWPVLRQWKVFHAVIQPHLPGVCELNNCWGPKNLRGPHEGKVAKIARKITSNACGKEVLL